MVYMYEGITLRPCPARAAGLHYTRITQYQRLVCLHYLPVADHFIEDVVRLLDVEHYVQLAHVLEVLVEGLHQVVDELQVRHLVLHRPFLTYSFKSSPMMKNKLAYLL